MAASARKPTKQNGRLKQMVMAAFRITWTSGKKRKKEKKKIDMNRERFLAALPTMRRLQIFTRNLSEFSFGRSNRREVLGEEY
ncbi:Hypothetical predicted protein [Octopus vulgaris]|uniref:Uncharacterized protein n=1 Tax=Octopus vulgaris TaxID=6645 RepID=A0AA36FA05_OCTVU|nr:Hypothetical predicted protein [Octopus vulgaris]